jgi:hypothetical protein
VPIFFIFIAQERTTRIYRNKCWKRRNYLFNWWGR